MRKRIFTLLIIGMTFQPVCSSPEEPNCLLNRNNTETEMYIEFFKQGASEPTDFNDISGDVGVAIKNIPMDADKVFVYIDEVQIGNWVRDDIFSHEWFGFESDRFSNGRHRVKLVSINSDEVKNYPPIDAYFKNLLYNVRGNDYFHPTHSYHFSGIYNGEKSLEVKLTELNGEVIWSNTYSGNYIDINIPGSVFGTEQLCKLNITDGSRSVVKTLGKEFRKEDFGIIDINEEQSRARNANSSIPEGNEKTLAPPQHKRELAKSGQARTSIEFFQVDKYFIPPTDETVAILLYPQYAKDSNYQPAVLFGDRQQAEKLMGKSLEPKRIIEGRDWLVKIMDAYKAALKEAKEKKFYRDNHDTTGQIIFVTKKKGYIRAIGVDAYNVYDDYMESGMLKSYFYELGLTEKPLPGKPPKEFELVPTGDYFVPSADETTAILLYSYFSDPVALVGGKEQAEKIMGEYLKPKKLFEDHNLLKKIVGAYRTALKEAEGRHFECSDGTPWNILFVTPMGGYMRTFGMDEDAIYDNHMESGPLKTLFDESGLTDELLTGRWSEFEFIAARKYRIPQKDKTVAILLYSDNDSRQPAALFGDKEQTEQLMAGKLDSRTFEPKRVFEGREWLEKIMDAYGTALKEAEEKKFHHGGDRNGLIVFVTMKKGYMKRIGVDVNTVYDSDMESELLKKYFDELGLTKELLAGEPNKVSQD